MIPFLFHFQINRYFENEIWQYMFAVSKHTDMVVYLVAQNDEAALPSIKWNGDKVNPTTTDSYI